LRSVAVLLRNTTWKCGRVERLIIDYLQKRLRMGGYAQTPVREMIQHFNLNSKQKSELIDALRRLEKRRIIRLNGF